MKRFAVTVCAQEHERYYPTPPHPRVESVRVVSLN